MKDGGQAFPVPRQQVDRFSGMTLRDYFAGQALAGCTAYCGLVDKSSLGPLCYEMADNMLKAREV